MVIYKLQNSITCQLATRYSTKWPNSQSTQKHDNWQQDTPPNDQIPKKFWGRAGNAAALTAEPELKVTSGTTIWQQQMLKRNRGQIIQKTSAHAQHTLNTFYSKRKITLWNGNTFRFYSILMGFRHYQEGSPILQDLDVFGENSKWLVAQWIPAINGVWLEPVCFRDQFKWPSPSAKWSISNLNGSYDFT
jgi:hypothetical protein